jgi:type I restriction enzyme S subunit
MIRLPDGWDWSTLGGVADTQLGKMLSKKSKTGVRSRPYLRNVNVQWHRIDLDDVPEMDFTEEESAKYDLVPGDLLVCEGGEVGRAATWRGGRKDVHFQKALHRIRPLGGVEPKFLEYAMRWSADTDRFAPLVTGSTISHLPQQALRQVPIPVPPLPEQRRIVDAIEEHLSRLDAAEASTRTALARLSQLSVAPAEAVWDEEPIRTSLAGIGTAVTGSTPSTSDSELWDGSFPFATPGDLDHGGHVATTRRGLSEAGRRAARAVPAGSVLVTCIGATLGKASLAVAPMATNQQINTLIVDDAVAEATFVLAMLSCPRGQRALWEASSSTTLPILNKSRFVNVEVPLPMPDRQRELVAEIDAITEESRRLRVGLVAALQRAGSLRRSILAAAFSGRLAAQNPSDEPALVLLERIAAERAAEKPTRGRKRATT